MKKNTTRNLTVAAMLSAVAFDGYIQNAMVKRGKLEQAKLQNSSGETAAQAQ